MSKPRASYHSLRALMTFCRQYRRSLFLAGIGFAIADLCLAAIPYLIGQLIGSLAQASPDHHAAVVFVILLIGSSSLHDITWRGSELLFLKYVNPISYAYETLVFQNVITKPYAYFVDKFTGKISSYVSTLGVEARDFLLEVFFNYIAEFITLFAVVAILFSVNAWTGLLFIVSITIMIIAGRFTIGYSNRAEKRFTDTQSTKNSKIIDIFGNFVNVKSFHTEWRELQTVRREQAKTLDDSRRAYLWGVLFWGLMSLFIRQIIWPSTIILNFYLYNRGQISIGEFTTLLSTILLFSNYIWDVVWRVSQINLRLARTEEAYTYLFGSQNIALQKPTDLRAPTNTLVMKESLSLNGLSFSYPDAPNTAVLQNISLTITKGEKIGVVGKSGSGKSTITKLLLGYYEGEHGTLQVDGQPTSGHDLANLISFVPQDTSLFHRSVHDNIAYATTREVTRAEVIKAAKQAHADEFISGINGNYDALVGERGVKLSAGQRQRIAIARAYLDNKPILILDEATSALDSESEVLIQDALEALWSDKTVIAIAHRLSTLRHMDRILVLDHGKIAEFGSHNDLLQHKGIYAKLWAHQSGGFLEE